MVREIPAGDRNIEKLFYGDILLVATSPCFKRNAVLTQSSLSKFLILFSVAEATKTTDIVDTTD